MLMNGVHKQPPKVQLPLEALMPLIREQLVAGQKVRLTPHGNSMWPMLRSGRDMVELSPLPQRLKKYDLPLYRRDDGRYLLHRIIRVEAGGCTCSGDGQLRREPGVQRAQMIALVTAFCRDGRWYPVSHPAYWLYCRLWPACKLGWRLVKGLRYRLKRLRSRRKN